jgi:hypothetical protein
VEPVDKNGARMELPVLTGLTEKERKLIDLIRSTGYGEIRIAVQDGEPIRVEEVKKSIKL